ncbi:cytochrome c oxidase subunit 2A [Salipaludibacillus aurantiacus]|uniref:Cytochrome c oxidase subunit IIa family protein n=1 Tax=Salipaludibacillus aurantiacus TaxID=1601833 RepID=A0A1H9WRC3_9BACI|nr:cytochrome c oxidase subunit 2A [Salipaludibacillus aurantiacus]SES36364.1 Cytochrome c oxidase subunit IIa family protein [Salipaludibacillus aurantiacus]
MSRTVLKTQQHQQLKQEDHSSLKGTLVFVMFLGAFILVSWFAVFYLFIIRT